MSDYLQRTHADLLALFNLWVVLPISLGRPFQIALTFSPAETFIIRRAALSGTAALNSPPPALRGTGREVATRGRGEAGDEMRQRGPDRSSVPPKQRRVGVGGLAGGGGVLKGKAQYR